MGIMYGAKRSWLLVGIAMAVSSQPAIAQKSSQATLLRCLDGRRQEVSGLQFEPDGLRWANAGEGRFEEFVSIDWNLRRIRPSTSLIILSNGDQLDATLSAIEEENIVVARYGESIQIPLEFVKAVLPNLPETTSARRNRWRFLSRPAREDTVDLVTGDAVVGEVLSSSDIQLVMQTAAGDRRIPLRSIACLRFSTELMSALPKGSNKALLQTTRDEILSVTKVTTEGNQLKLKLATGTTVRTQLTTLRRVHFRSKTLHWLSELKPATFKHTPGLGRQKPWQADRSVAGYPIMQNTQRQPNGIGVTSRMELTWKLNGNYRWLHSGYGLDDAGSRGAAIFGVLVDGKESFRSPTVRKPGQLSLRPINVENAQELTLVVDYGPNSDFNDVATWIAPVIVRKTD